MSNYVLKRDYKTEIHAYKFNGEIYRTWKWCKVFDNNANELILYGKDTLITEKNGGKWKTNNVSFWIFPKNAWYNILIFLKNNKPQFYCNIASPFVYDGLAIKYIDFDLDLKVNSLNDIVTKDVNEFEKHSVMYNYPEKIRTISFYNLNKLKNMAKNGQGYFDVNFVNKLYLLHKIQNAEK